MNKPRYGEEYYLEHRDAIDAQRAAIKKYRIKHADRLKQERHDFNLEHSEEQKQYQKEYRKNNKKMVNEKDLIRRTSLKNRLKAVRIRAARWNREYDLDLEWAQSQPMTCYYSGRELTLESHRPNTVSFERIDNSKGYTRDNTVLCSVVINMMKKAMTEDEFIYLCRDIVKWQSKNNPELL